MTLRVIFDIFSGRPNPAIELDAADSVKLMARLQPARRLNASRKMPPFDSLLGYRGLVIEQVGRASAKLPQRCRVREGRVYAPGSTYEIRGTPIEEFFLGLPAVAKSKLFPQEVAALIQGQETAGGSARKPVLSTSAIIGTKPAKCPCAPLYEPGWWNDAASGGARQFYNNCYNYACNYRSDTFAQPGRAAGQMYSGISCAAMTPAAARDDLILLPASKAIRCPKEGALVALVIWPNADFHWYRMGRDGLWTHKPGGNPVTNLDNSGSLITDPRKADRGPYVDFCGMMVVMHGHIKIN